MAVLFIAIFSEKLSIYYLPLFAFFGGIAVVLLIYALAWKGGVNPLRLILIGFGIKALLSAAQTILMIYGPIWRTNQSYIWLTGSLHATQQYQVNIVFWWMIVLVPLLIVAVRALNMQQVSDDITVSLGGRLQFIRFGLIILAACLAGISIAFSGGIGFIGLMAPHTPANLLVLLMNNYCLVQDC